MISNSQRLDFSSNGSSVSVTDSEDPRLDSLKSIVAEFVKLGFDGFFEVEYSIITSNCVYVNFKGEWVKHIIGRRGRTLLSIQKLIDLMYTCRGDRLPIKVIIDAGGYKLGRLNFLKKVANEVAQRVYSSKRPWKMPRMNAFERLIIHKHVNENYPGLRTYSIGEGARRRVIVDVKSN